MHQRLSSAGKVPEWYSQKYREHKKMLNDTFLVQSLKDGIYYISKKMNISRYPQSEIHQLEELIKQTKKLTHPNIVKLKETYKEKDHIIQIIDYVGSQTLRNRLKSHHELPTKVATQYLLQILLALDYLDNQKFITFPAIDTDSIYLNKYGSLRVSFAFDRKKTDIVEEVKRIGEMFGTIKISESQSQDFKQIQRTLLCQALKPQELLDHPFFLEAMHELYQESIQKDAKIKDGPRKQPQKDVIVKDNYGFKQNMIQEPPVIKDNPIKDRAIKDLMCRPKSNAEQTTKLQKNQKKLNDQKEPDKLEIRLRNNSHQNLPRDRCDSITKKASNDKLDKIDVKKLKIIEPNPQVKIKQTILLPKIVIKNQIPQPCLKSPLKSVKKQQESPTPILKLTKRSISMRESPEANEQTNTTVEIKDQLISVKDYHAESDVFDLTNTHPMSKILNSLEFKIMLKSEQKDREDQTNNDDSVDIDIAEAFSDEDTEELNIQRDTNQFCRTSRKQELQELLEIYKSQLMTSASKQIGSCFLNLSEIQEASVENSTVGESTFCEK